jgi:hypothetical protein
MINKIYSYFSLKVQSSCEKYERNIKTKKLAMKLKLFQKIYTLLSYSPKNSCSTIIMCLAKNDHLK